MGDHPKASMIPLLSSILIALMLSIIPLPGQTIWLRPAWLAMVLVYWGVKLPSKMGIIYAWILGLLLDIMLASLLGEHALAIALVIYLASKMERQFNFFPLWQQSLCIGGLIFIYQLVIVIVQGISGNLNNAQLFYLPALSSMCLWPWLYLLLQSYSRRYNLN